MTIDEEHDTVYFDMIMTGENMSSMIHVLSPLHLPSSNTNQDEQTQLIITHKDPEQEYHQHMLLVHYDQMFQERVMASNTNDIAF